MLKEIASPEFFPKINKPTAGPGGVGRGSDQKKSDNGASFADSLKNADRPGKSSSQVSEPAASSERGEKSETVKEQRSAGGSGQDGVVRRKVEGGRSEERQGMAPRRSNEGPVAKTGEPRSAAATSSGEDGGTAVVQDGETVANQPARKGASKPVDSMKTRGEEGTVNVEGAAGAAVLAAAAMSVPAPMEAKPAQTDPEILGALESFREQQAQLKQKSVQRFMGQMQEEFGVAPDAIVQAFAKMDQQTLMGPPEEAVSQFVENLPVAPENRGKVASLYRQMVTETGEAELNHKLAGQQLDVSYEVIGSKEHRLRELNSSLDRMNQQFFMPGQARQGESEQAPIGAGLDRNAMSQKGAKTAPAAASARKSDGLAAMAALGAGTATAATASASAASTGASDAGIAKAADGGSSAFSLEGMNLPELSAPQSNGSGMPSFGNGGTGQQQASQNFAGQNGATAFKTPDWSAEPVKGSVKKTAVEGEAAGIGAGGQAPSHAAAVAGGSAQQLPQATAALPPSAMMAVAKAPSLEDREENIRELIKNAQVMVKKGGGEMRMELKPEGMGRVNLKVQVENGQVNIEMVTQNDKAKKLIEEGLSDLKANLAAHKLQVDSVKVDLADGFQKRFEQQSSDAQREQMREFAQSFMGQFREDRQSFRQGFAENAGVRSYNRSPKRADMAPEPTVNENRRRDSDRRLSVIA